nr:endonuclease/exonuclease/phosphatase family protein [uncultured Rhodoferax sp.]
MRNALATLFISCSLTGHAAEFGLAAFNIAWAGTEQDFSEHVRVCTTPSVNWCDTRAKVAKGAEIATPEEVARAKQCEASFDQAAGGPANALLVAPCNAYKLTASKWKKATPQIYAEKLEGLQKTVDRLIRDRRVDVIAFQEVRSAEVIKKILGSHAGDFDSCVADHSSFQTVGFAWRRSLTSMPGKCTPEKTLAIKELPNAPSSLRFLRPGISLTLQIGSAPVTLMNVHLKSSCANLKDDSRFKGHELTDLESACQVLNRQVAPLESWVENVAKASPLFVLLGDFNRRLDEESAVKVPASKVRKDGTDPASTNKTGPNGEVASRFLWQELSDGNPSLVQVPLAASNDCSGFVGLDHILISDALAARQTGQLSSEKLRVEQKDAQVIGTSDHCPRVTRLSL